MGTPYHPKDYWEKRLDSNFNLRGVGHLSFSNRYNVWLYRRKERVIAAALQDQDLKGRRVLDIGCGTGFFVDWYLSRGAEVCGIDITEVSIRQLAQKYSCELHVQDITAVDYQPFGEFDITNMWDVIYHIVDLQALERALDNIARGLKPGGLFLFTDWFGAPTDRQVAEHVRARCLATYQQLLPARGFELVASYPLYSLLNRPHLGRLDNRLGSLYYLMDNMNTAVSDKNLSLTVWRMRGRPT